MSKFDIKDFTYDEEKHLGYYKGELVPSVTQLLDILYPLDSNIPEERLKKASERGTQRHSLFEIVNSYFDNSLDFKTNLEQAISDTIHTNEQEGKQDLINYVSFLSTYKLRPFDYEEIIFLLDENGELICYGHYDCTLMATQDISVNGKDLFRENYLYMFDYKTTSLFAKKKTELQLSIYSLAYEQSSKNFISNIFGLWVRDGIKLIPLERKDNNYTISLCKQLRDIWRDKNGNQEIC